MASPVRREPLPAAARTARGARMAPRALGLHTWTTSCARVVCVDDWCHVGSVAKANAGGETE